MNEKTATNVAPSFNSHGTPEVPKGISQSEAEFIINRARTMKIDVVGRLQWIEDAAQMIENAKKSRT